MKEYLVWLAKLVTVLVLLFVFIPLFLGAIVAVSQRGSEASFSVTKHNVAVVELKGIIDSSKDVLDQLYKEAHNPKSEGIVLRIDSPGGAVGPSQDIYNAVLKLKSKKPIVASMGALAASGGFYSAIGASKVLAQPGTMTGSIGVILQIPNFSKIMNVVGVDVATIKSGKLKDAGNTFRPMTDEEKGFLETTAKSVHEQFLRDVSLARNIPLETLREFGDGRVILGEEAKRLNLIDGFGTVYDAARLVFELKGAPLDADVVPNLVYPADKFGDLKKLLDVATKLTGFVSNQTLPMELRYQMP